ncbi:hypothetical protein AB0A63_13795 [Lentzea sp. NPDC042327]|uniref:hypothetical protein n=1 Tax=Lentzea sp. NPDC042327 TaxID=3154801 RepID=UPI0033C74F63
MVNNDEGVLPAAQEDTPAPYPPIPMFVVRSRTRSAIYAKVAGDLDALLDMAREQPQEWLAQALRGVHVRYVAEMERFTAEGDRLMDVRRRTWRSRSGAEPEPAHTLSLLIANATPDEAAGIRAVAVRAGLMSQCACGTYNTAADTHCAGCVTER